MILDLAALRTLVLAVDLGGFSKAAERLHRTPAAISLQMRTLEERLGQQLFRKVGRQQLPTEAGERLAAYARRMLQLNDEALLALQAGELVGEVRFGMPQDFADGWLPDTLARFSASQRSVRLDVSVCGSGAVNAGVTACTLDLGLAFGDGPADAPDAIGQWPIEWFGAPTLAVRAGEPVPLLLFESPCVFRRLALDALQRESRAWQVALTSTSVSALWAAARAGLGVLPRAGLHRPAGVQAVGPALGLPPLPAVTVSLRHQSEEHRPAVTALAGIVRDDVRSRLDAANT
ncbi:LysR substrate-binding domain-containing protein [Roseateles sp. NT4]|uniref:LysR substrate-binding domain-containing protein n=1 Tax=Roseateles sp. NT4 TaxID=3453715 RepID=UPI003EEAEEB0